MSAGGLLSRAHIAAALRGNRCYKELCHIAARTGSHMLSCDAVNVHGKRSLHHHSSATWHFGRAAYLALPWPHRRSLSCRSGPRKPGCPLGSDSSCRSTPSGATRWARCAHSAGTEQRSESLNQNGVAPTLTRRTRVKDIKVPDSAVRAVLVGCDPCCTGESRMPDHRRNRSKILDKKAESCSVSDRVDLTKGLAT